VYVYHHRVIASLFLFDGHAIVDRYLFFALLSLVTTALDRPHFGAVLGPINGFRDRAAIGTLAAALGAGGRYPPRLCLQAQAEFWAVAIVSTTAGRSQIQRRLIRVSSILCHIEKTSKSRLMPANRHPGEKPLLARNGRVYRNW
jgi:hypothetical protein